MDRLTEYIVNNKNKLLSFSFILIVDLLLVFMLLFIISQPQLPIIFFGSLILFGVGIIYTTYHFWPNKNNKSILRDKLFFFFSLGGTVVICLDLAFRSMKREEFVINCLLAFVFFSMSMLFLFDKKVKEPFKTILKILLAISMIVLIALNF